MPNETRKIIIRDLKLTKNKTRDKPHRKHGNVPL